MLFRSRFDVSVADARGEPLRHLEEKDFRVTCQGNPVKAIELARVQNQTPLQNIVLLLDTSESVRGDALEAAKSGAKHLLLSLQGEPGVSVQVLAFNDKVARVCDWTGDTLHAASRLDGLHATGRTALFHAIEAACDSSRGRSGVRKLILFTDGRNTIRSLANLEQLIKRLKQAQVEVFIIGLKTHELDVETLRRLADGTDGVYLEAPDAARLVETFQAASSLIRRFVYRLIVTPGNSPVGDVLALEIRVGGENAITLSQNVKVQSAVSSLGR